MKTKYCIDVSYGKPIKILNHKICVRKVVGAMGAAIGNIGQQAGTSKNIEAVF